MLSFVPFTHLYERVYDLSRQATSDLSLLLVGGCSRSGKSTLSGMLSERLMAEHVKRVVINLDAWLLGAEQRAPLSSVMERYDCKAIVSCVKGLLEGGVIYPPVYDAVSRRRVAETSRKGITATSGLVIVEGVIALALNELVDISPLKVFVQVSDEIRIERLFTFYRDVKKLSVSEVETVIAEREREEVPFVKNTAARADITIHNS